MSKPAILFVCLGNICRSPLAEGAMRAEAARRSLDVYIDSAGTGDWHLGHAPDERAQAVAKSKGVDISGLRARLVTPNDFTQFTHIVAMDSQNLVNLNAMRPSDATASLSLLLDYVPGRGGDSVADPFFGEAKDFEKTWIDVTSGAAALAALLESA